MKDLFVLTADAEAQAVMNSVLSRYQSLNIQEIAYDVDRNPMRDSGMVINGPEFVRLKKGAYQKVLLIWDYHGSGWEIKHSPEICQSMIQDRLAKITWKDHSGAVVLVPELEEWLWHNPASLCGYYGITAQRLTYWIDEYAAKRLKTIQDIKATEPKELFEYICLEKLRRTISPRDFKKIASIASLRQWEKSASFRQIVELVRKWFKHA